LVAGLTDDADADYGRGAPVGHHEVARLKLGQGPDLLRLARDLALVAAVGMLGLERRTEVLEGGVLAEVADFVPADADVAAL
jgi:hypothetical protein